MATKNMQGGSDSNSINNVKNAFLNNNVHAARDVILNVLERDPEEEETACIADLFSNNPCDDREGFITALGCAFGKGCSWITNDENYQSWHEGAKGLPQLLWLPARQGMGKTTLAVWVSQMLEAKVRETNKNDIVLYYFCSNKEGRENTTNHILRGLMFQLVAWNPKLVKQLLVDWKIQKQNLFKSSSLEPLWRLFEAMLRESNARRVYCVLDGLNQCEEGSLKGFLRKVNAYFAPIAWDENPSSDKEQAEAKEQKTDLKSATTFFSHMANPHSSSSNADLPDLRMMIISTPDTPAWIKLELQEFPKVQWSDHAQWGRLNQFIDEGVREIVEARGKSTDVADAVIAALRRHGDGTFLWAGLAIDMLKQSQKGDLLDEIPYIPTRTEDFYCHLLRKVPAKLKEAVTTVLQWVVLAEHKLKTAELQSAIQRSTQSTVSDADMTEIKKLCASLLQVQNEQWSLKHQTVQTLLTAPDSPLLDQADLRVFHVDSEYAHGEIVGICMRIIKDVLSEGTIRVTNTIERELAETAQKGPSLRRLISAGHFMPAHQTSYIKPRLAKHPLLQYAVMHWPYHARHASLDTIDFTDAFFNATSKLRQTWWESFWISSNFGFAWGWTAPTDFTLLHLAAYFGILPLARYVEKRGRLKEDMRANDSHGYRPLYYTWQENHPDLMRWFIRRGATKSHRGTLGRFIFALPHACAKRNDAEAIHLLMENGQSPEELEESFDNSDFTTRARLTGKLLWRPSVMATSASLATSSSSGSSKTSGESTIERDSQRRPLHIAAAYGAAEAAKALLDHKATVDPRTNFGWTPLHYAAECGHTAVLELLHEHGAKVEAVTFSGLTALHLAAWEGHTDAVRKLLAHGAKLEARNNIGNTPLHLAALYGKPATVRALVDAGADIDARRLGGTSPGATTATVVTGRTPLHLAAGAGMIKATECLLDLGATIAIEDGNGQTPSQLATANAHRNVSRRIQQYARARSSVDATSAPVHSAGSVDSTGAASERPESGTAPSEVFSRPSITSTAPSDESVPMRKPAPRLVESGESKLVAEPEPAKRPEQLHHGASCSDLRKITTTPELPPRPQQSEQNAYTAFRYLDLA